MIKFILNGETPKNSFRKKESCVKDDMRCFLLSFHEASLDKVLIIFAFGMRCQTNRLVVTKINENFHM